MKEFDALYYLLEQMHGLRGQIAKCSSGHCGEMLQELAKEIKTYNGKYMDAHPQCRLCKVDSNTHIMPWTPKECTECCKNCPKKTIEELREDSKVIPKLSESEVDASAVLAQEWEIRNRINTEVDTYKDTLKNKMKADNDVMMPESGTVITIHISLDAPLIRELFERLKAEYEPYRIVLSAHINPNLLLVHFTW